MRPPKSYSIEEAEGLIAKSLCVTSARNQKSQANRLALSVGLYGSDGGKLSHK